MKIVKIDSEISNGRFAVTAVFDDGHQLRIDQEIDGEGIDVDQWKLVNIALRREMTGASFVECMRD